MRKPTVPVLLLAAVAAGCSDTPLQPDAGLDSPEGLVSLSHAVRNQPELQRALSAIRRATARYHDPDVAAADGYVNLGECIAGPPGAGDMGVHFVKGSAIDGAFDPAEPELLVYVPRGPGGGLHLASVEYYVPDGTPTEAEAPELEGQPFEVLPEGHPLYPGYALHAWVWLHNPSGMFADFNPKVSCP